MGSLMLLPFGVNAYAGIALPVADFVSDNFTRRCTTGYRQRARVVP